MYKKLPNIYFIFINICIYVTNKICHEKKFVVKNQLTILSLHLHIIIRNNEAVIEL